MKILLASILPINDISSWSGICKHVYEQLSQHHDVEFCYAEGAHRYQQNLARLSYWSYRFSGKRRNVYFSPRASKLYQRELLKHENRFKPDLILFLGSGTELSYHDTETPCYLLADAIFSLLKDWYPNYSNLGSKEVAEALRMEKRAFLKFDKLFFTSDWALNATASQYPEITDRLYRTNFGSNIPVPENEDIQVFPTQYSQLNMLAVGKDVKRKGLEQAQSLSRNLGAQLTIIGTHKMLNKAIPSELSQLVDEYRKAHVFLLFSTADCTPIVINEANSMSTPVIAFEVGGVASQIINGINGYIVKDLIEAEQIIELWKNNPGQYQEICKSSFDHYKKNLSWDKFEADLLA